MGEDRQEEKCYDKYRQAMMVKIERREVETEKGEAGRMRI